MLLMLVVNINQCDILYITLVSLCAISGGLSDSDLVDVSKDDSYKPDKGKGNGNFWNDHT